MSYEEGSKEEEATESPEEAKAEGDNAEGSTISAEYQKQCESLIDSATIPQLEYVISSASDLKKKLMKSQGKAKLSTNSFTTEGMPD